MASIEVARKKDTQLSCDVLSCTLFTAQPLGREMPHPILTVSTNEIQSLNDERARELVARLVRAEASRLGATSPDVTWGGDQRAKDGGIDVRFSAEALGATSVFLPASTVGYQVKAENFPPSKIQKELLPKGRLSASIAEILRHDGSYIIVSTRDSVSDSSLAARRAKMAECCGQLEPGTGTLAFLDARRIADWAERFPSIVAWVKHSSGGPLKGWKPYGPWAYRESDSKAEYLLDDRVKVFTPDAKVGSGAIDAIDAIRSDMLAGRSVRVVGLSGVGKTRLVQALFDPRVLTKSLPLPQDGVIYADLSDHLEPQPTSMAEALIDADAPSFFVIDNCGQDLHKRLAEIVDRGPQKVALLTVEYDIQDDLPEGTRCYRLESSSDELIKALLSRRYSHLSEPDISRVASFSDGNARVAFALASASERSGDLAQLGDDALFRRLFHQKRSENEELLRCAEAATLLYSFEGIETDQGSELALLAQTVGLSVTTLYRGIAELQRRGLVQQRGKWRAVLPHAIANRLASRALENNPASSVVDTLLVKADDRVAKSFSRRLGYLHNSTHARQIVASLLNPGGSFEFIEDLTDVGRQALKNVMPTDPIGSLSAFKRMVERKDVKELDAYVASDLVAMARSLAYDESMFDDALDVLMAFAEREDTTARSSAPDAIASLFTCYLSGTNASPEKRAAVVLDLLQSKQELHQALGRAALKQALQTSHFVGHLEADFGSRPRDYGWKPETRLEIVRWYGGFIEVASQIALGTEKQAIKVRQILGQAVRDLCEEAGMLDAIEAVGRALAEKGGWPDGWVGVRETIYWNRSSAPPEILSRLIALERALAPRDLLGEIRASILTQDAALFGLLDGEGYGADYGTRREKVQERATELGRMAAESLSVLSLITPDLLRTRGSETIFSFGVGVGSSLKDHSQYLAEASRIVATLDGSDANFLFVRGLLAGWHGTDAAAADLFLDAAVLDPVWGQSFPELQCVVGLENRGIERVFEALNAKLAPIWQYRYLAMGGLTDALDVRTIGKLVQALSGLSGGPTVAIDLLGMVIHSGRVKNDDFRQDVALQIGYFLIDTDLTEIDTKDTMVEYHFDQILAFALTHAPPSAMDEDIINKLLSWERSEDRKYAFRRGRFLQPFFRLRPRLALNAVYQPDADGRFRTARSLASNYDNERGRRPMEAIPAREAMEWCAESPTDRYPFIAETCALFVPKTSEDQPQERLSELAGEVFRRAPDQEHILEIYLQRLMPMSWSGSRAAKLQRRLGILDDLLAQAHPDQKQMLSEARARMLRVVAEMGQREDEIESTRNETFE